MNKLQAENAKLKSAVRELQTAMDLKGVTAANSLTALVASARSQSAITSFNEMIASTIYAPLSLNWNLLTYLYKTHGVLQAAIDMPVQDALRGGLEFQSGELDNDDIQELQEKIEELEVLETVAEATNWARLYGGSVIIINSNDDDSEQPLNIHRLKKLEFYAASRWELLNPTGWKPDAKPLDQPIAPIGSDYFLFYGRKIHRSRIITLSGKKAPYTLRWQLSGWGMSEIERMVEEFNKYLKTSNVLYELLEEAKIDVYRLKGLNQNIISAAARAKTEERMALMNKLKSYQRAVVLDMEDEFAQKQMTFSGIAEVMKENRIGLSCALRIPMTKLFGISAAGFNSGEDDIENYNAMVESEVRQPMKKVLHKLLTLLSHHVWQSDFEIKFDFKPLRVMSTLDEENVKTQKHNRYMSLYQAGLLTSHELGQLLEKEKMMPIETEMAAGGLEDHPTVELPGQEGDEGGGKGEGGE